MSSTTTLSKNKRNSRCFNETNLKSGKKILKLKNQKAILLAQLGILIFLGGYFIGAPTSSDENTDQFNPIGLFSSEYIIKNLRDDSTSFSKNWKISEGESLSINILNPISISDESIDIIKKTILSTETIDIGNIIKFNDSEYLGSTYYVGWKGALEATSKTKIPIPKNFEIINSKKSDGDIIVILSNIKDRSGNTGYTKTVIENGQIVKAFITIYEVDSLSKDQLGTIMRHEFGHAMGLDHSTATKDLMAPTIDMTYPYISHCNITSIFDLYNENSSGTTTCEK
jgi:hypothetical protein